MKNILKLNAISSVANSEYPADYNVTDNAENPIGIMVRSFDMHSYDLPESVIAVARAGAGTNNIPTAEYTKKGVVVFNTPGANANAVKELVLSALFLGSRKIVDAIKWVDTLKGNGDNISKMVEKGKKNFVGSEILGKTLGVIGLGAIGIKVANAAYALGMEVVGYDPYLSVENALKITNGIKKVNTLDELVSQSDYLTVHVPLLARGISPHPGLFLHLPAASQQALGYLCYKSLPGKLLHGRCHRLDVQTYNYIWQAADNTLHHLQLLRVW